MEDGSLLLPGNFPVHDLGDIGVDLDPMPEGDYTTIAGLVITLLGHLPTQPGEVVDVDGWSVRIEGLDRRAISSVRLRRRSAVPDSSART
jgi:putative hemolysin